MADLATPSAATMGTIDAGASTPVNKQAVKAKPEKPDEEQYQKDLKKAEEEHKAAQDRYNAIRSKVDLTRPSNKDSPAAKHQQELRSELASIRQKQQGSKTSRTVVQNKIKDLDQQVKNRIAEQKIARSKVAFKSVEEVDQQIQRLEKQVDSGTMKLVDEKKALADVTSLRKQRKVFAGFDEAQKGIDDVKAQIAELRKSLDDPESKALSDRYTVITTELDTIKAEQDAAFKNLNELRDQRSAAQAEQQQKYMSMKEIKDNYYQAKKAYADYEHEAYRQRKEKQRQEREQYEQGKRRKVADQKLEDASAPAYMDEILTAQGLIRYFDPSSAAAKHATGPGLFAATAQRTVDENGIKGTALKKKGEDEENYFVGSGGKKGKKGRRGAAAATGSPAPEGRFNLSMGIIEELAKISVEPPSSQADVPAVVEKLQEKLKFWREDQDRKTKENIEKAKREIEKLEGEASGTNGSSSSSKNNESNNSSKSTEGGAAKKSPTEMESVNGSASASEKASAPAPAGLTQEKDAAADVADELEKAKIEASTTP